MRYIICERPQSVKDTMALHLENRYLKSETNFQFLTFQNMDDPRLLEYIEPWLKILEFQISFQS